MARQCGFKPAGLSLAAFQGQVGQCIGLALTLSHLLLQAVVVVTTLFCIMRKGQHTGVCAMSVSK